MPRHWNELSHQSNLKEHVHFNDWTPEKLRETRKKFKITQKEIAEAMGVGKVMISQIENNRSASPIAIKLYGLVLEQYWAGIHGYIPAYRKIGENKFMEETNGLHEIQRCDVPTEAS